MRDALEAVLADVEREGVDRIVLGGDVAAGPQPQETLALLEPLADKLLWLRGNAERWLDPDEPDVAGGSEWSREQLSDDQRTFLVSLPPTQRLEIDSLGHVLFCHAVPQNDLDIVTPLTPEERLAGIVDGVGADVVVAGHTHIQDDRRVGGVRWVNAGSVGMPYEDAPGAYWALLGPGVELRRTEYAAEAPLASRREAAEYFESLVRE